MSIHHHEEAASPSITTVAPSGGSDRVAITTSTNTSDYSTDDDVIDSGFIEDVKKSFSATSDLSNNASVGGDTDNVVEDITNTTRSLSIASSSRINAFQEDRRRRESVSSTDSTA